MKRGKLITLEGIEGSGKSTCVPFITQWIRSQGHDCIASREPGGTKVAESIRTILLEPTDETIVAESEFLLMAAARKQHIETVIRPALEQGTWVVVDRFMDSSVAYQGYGRGLCLQFIDQVHAQILGDVLPDITLWFDLSLSTSRTRVEQRQLKSLPGFTHNQHRNWHNPGDRFERLGNDFFARVRQGFATLAKQQPKRIVTIDAEEDAVGVRGQVLATLSHHCYHT